MFRVGILGAENSHAEGFIQIFNESAEHREEFADIRVVGIGGNYPEENKALAEKYGLEFVVEKPEDMLGKIDALMVTARDGIYHADFARPFIEAGIPAFIDKPFTSNPAQAVEFARLAKAKGVPLCGGTSLKTCPDVESAAQLVKALGDEVIFGNLNAPVEMVNEYGDFWFYSSHLVEMCLWVFGQNPQWVWASNNGRGVTTTVRYPQYDVTCHFTDGHYRYGIFVETKKEAKYIPVTNITMLPESRHFAEMLRTGKMPHTYEELVRPVFVMNAIKESFETGKVCHIPDIEI